MSTQVQRRRGTTAQHASFTGAVGEITVDTTKNTAVVHDGTTLGGWALPTLAGTETLSNKTISLAAGAVGAPSLYLSTDTTSGLYRIGANNIGVTISGAKVLDISSTELGVTGALRSTGSYTLDNAAYITTKNSSGTTVRMLGVSGANAAYVGPIDSTASITGVAYAVSTVVANQDFYIGGAVKLGLSSTGAAVTGSVSATSGYTSTADGTQLARTGASTGAQLIQLANTSGQIRLGVENSAGGAQVTGSTGYDSFVTDVNGVGLSFGVSQTLRMRLSSTGLAVTGTLSSTGDITRSGNGGNGVVSISAINTGTALNDSVRIFADNGAASNTNQDAYFLARTNLVLWSMGIDHSDSDSWKLDLGASPGSNTILKATSTGLAVTGVCDSTGSYTALNATAIPAGGTAGSGYKFSSTSNFGVFFGSGAPTLSAAQGSLYLRSDGSSTSTRAYINTNGTTGWTAITTAT